MAMAQHFSEINLVRSQLEDTWNGDPWFGRPVLQLLDGITEEEAYAAPGGQHSAAQLVWHMVLWREFVLTRISPQEGKNSRYFEANDWREATANTPYTWAEGVKALHQSQTELLLVLSGHDDAMLNQQVPERNYNFRKLLYGLVQHDIYHLGQVAYAVKLVRGM